MSTNKNIKDNKPTNAAKNQFIKTVAFLKPALLCAFSLTVSLLLIFSATGNPQSAKKYSISQSIYAMYVDENLMGYIDCPENGLSMLRNAESNAKLLVEESCPIQGELEYRISNKKLTLDNNLLSKNLFNYAIKDYSQGNGLFIDDKLISVSTGKTVLNDFIDTLKEGQKKALKLAIPGQIEKVELLNKIEVKNKFFKNNLFKTNEELFSTSSDFIKNNLTYSSSTTISPSLRLAGNTENVSIMSNEPTLLCSVTYACEQTSELPYNVEYVLDDTKPAGEVEVLNEGKNGLLKEVTHVTLINGVEKTQVADEPRILAKPLNSTVLIGTAIQINSPAPGQNSGFEWPYDGEISSYFGWREGNEYHNALDIRGPANSSVYASKDGTVVFSGSGGGYGNYVIIEHNDEESTLYAHFNSNSVKVGEFVAKGQEVGKIGQTGIATGNHVHFEIRINGVAEDPLNYLPER